MPDIDPAALSRPAGGLSTPVLKSITVTQPIPQKVTKTSQIIPARIDLEPLYTALKTSVAIEQWNIYKDATSRFMLGKLARSNHCHISLGIQLHAGMRACAFVCRLSIRAAHGPCAVPKSVTALPTSFAPANVQTLTQVV